MFCSVFAVCERYLREKSNSKTGLPCLKMDLPSILISAAAILLTILYFVTMGSKRGRISRALSKLPGPFPLPIIGTLYTVLGKPRRDMVPTGEEMIKKYGTLFRTWLGHHPTVHIIEAEHLEEVLSSMKYLDKSHVYSFLEPWLGTGLLTSTGKKWHSHRKIITPTFHFKILENFMEVFVEKSEILVEKLKTHSDGKVFDIYPYITRCTLDIICETAMGTEINVQNDTHSPYVKAVIEMSEFTLGRMLRPWLHPDFIFNLSSVGRRYKQCLKILHGFTNMVIQERKRLLSGNATISHGSSDEDKLLGKRKRRAFLDLLLETAKTGDKITDEEIREEVDTFMFEGHDTTTAGINWTMFLLGNHPEIQEGVYEELKEIFQDSDRPANTQDLQNMKYLERVIKESLRLFPSVPVISRQLNEDMKIGGYDIPSGVTLSLHIRSAHRNPKHFPNPLVFNPDNFLPENVQKRHPYAYIPFSAGPRNCIGQKFAMMEEKTILSYVLRHYKITSAEKVEDIGLIAELVLRPEDGIKVALSPRNTT